MTVLNSALLFHFSVRWRLMHQKYSVSATEVCHLEHSFSYHTGGGSMPEVRPCQDTGVMSLLLKKLAAGETLLQQDFLLSISVGKHKKKTQSTRHKKNTSEPKNLVAAIALQTTVFLF